METKDKKKRGRPKMAEKLKKVNVGIKLRPALLKAIDDSLEEGGNRNALIESILAEKYFK